MEGVELQNILIGELMEGRELIRKLEDQLEKSCSIELHKSLVKSIMDRWDKAMSLAKLMIPQEEQHLMDPTSRTVSPRSVMDSPKSISSKHAVNDQRRREICKKRKAMPKWVRQVRLCLSTGLEGHPEDGFSWRKYGQKDIFGSKHPRAYYRCTHLHSQGCLARKHVQRSDEDPSIFDVIYRGEHSCFSKQSLNKDDDHANSNYQMPLNQLKTEDQDRKNITTSLSFNSTPVRIVEIDDYNCIFSSPSPDDQVFDTCIFSPFMSSAKSESNYYSLTMFPDSMTVDLPALNLPEMNLTTDTSIAGFGLDGLELEANFSFDASCFA